MRKLFIILIVGLLLTGCNYKVVKVEDPKDKQIRELQEQLDKLGNESTSTPEVGNESTSTPEVANTPQVIERVTIKEVPTPIPAPTSQPQSEPNSNSESASQEDLVISSIQATPTYNSVTIKWKTNIDSTGYATIFPAPKNQEGNFSASSNVPGKYHEVTIMNLSSNRQYEYNITSNAEDDSDFTENKTFTTSYDLIKPKMTGVSYSTNGGITISLSFDEPVIYLFSSYFNSPLYEKRFGLTGIYKDYAYIYVSYPENGHLPGMELHYTVTIYDEADNSSNYEESIILKDIPGYF